LWPDPSAFRRVATLTPSTGDRPERQEKRDRGHLPHYARSRRGHHLLSRSCAPNKLPQLYLWEPDAYKDKVNSFTLYPGHS